MLKNDRRAEMEQVAGLPIQLAGSLGLSIVIGTFMLLAAGEDPLMVYSGLIEKGFFDPLGFMIAVQRMTPLILASAAACWRSRGGDQHGDRRPVCGGGDHGRGDRLCRAEMPKVLAIPIVLLAAGWLASSQPGFRVFQGGIGNQRGDHRHDRQHGGAPIAGNPAQRAVPALCPHGRSRSGIQPWAQLSQFSDLTNGAIGAGTHANTGIFASIGIVLCIAYVFKRSHIGYGSSMTSANFQMAEFSGIKARRSFYMAMMLSGAVAAMAGATKSLGIYRNASSGTISVGYNALIMALAGGNTFLGSMGASFVLGGLQSGAMNASWMTTVPRPFIDFLVALTMLFAAVPSMRLFFSGSTMSDVERLGGQFTNRE